MESKFNFQPVEKSSLGGGQMFPENIVRVNKTSISIGNSVARHFFGSLRTTASGGKVIDVSLAYDEVNQALQLSSDPTGNRENSFSFQCSGDDGGTWNLTTIPVGLKKLNVIRGDYAPVEGQYNIFQLAR